MPPQVPGLTFAAFVNEDEATVWGKPIDGCARSIEGYCRELPVTVSATSYYSE
jgi:hypothetical protein